MSFPRAIPDVDVDALVDRLDLETKVRLLSGADVWVTQPVPEIGLRSMTVSDGPVGVRGPNEDERDTSVALPSPSGLAASTPRARSSRACTGTPPASSCWTRRRRTAASASDLVRA